MGKLIRKQKGGEVHPPSSADFAEAQALEHAVQTMIEGPLSKWDHSRPLSSLNRADLRKLAIASITGWVLKRAALQCRDDTDPNSSVLSVE